MSASGAFRYRHRCAPLKKVESSEVDLSIWRSRRNSLVDASLAVTGTWEYAAHDSASHHLTVHIGVPEPDGSEVAPSRLTSQEDWHLSRSGEREGRQEMSLPSPVSTNAVAMIRKRTTYPFISYPSAHGLDKRPDWVPRKILHTDLLSMVYPRAIGPTCLDVVRKEENRPTPELACTGLHKEQKDIFRSGKWVKLPH